MLKLGHDPLTNMLCLFLIRRLVSRNAVEDSDAAPFRAFVEGDEEFGEDVCVELKQAAGVRVVGFGGGGVDVDQCGYRV
jgi:hypothetical protein